VVWTRNAAPFAATLDDVASLALPFVVQYAVTGYPRAIDAHTPRAAHASISALAPRFGPRAVSPLRPDCHLGRCMIALAAPA
jgi:hypothetical protein